MKKKNLGWNLAVMGIFTFVILNIALFIRGMDYNQELSVLRNNRSNNDSFAGKTETGGKCPDAQGGVDNAILQVKYFYSKFCFWCKREEPILRGLAEDYGDLVHIEWYDIGSCPELVNTYQVSGVPTFVFQTYNNLTEYSHYGFISEKDFMRLVCDVSGGCSVD